MRSWSTVYVEMISVRQQGGGSCPVTIGLYVESERFSNGARGTRKPCEIGANPLGG
jgi:hypothetical protein